MKSINPATGEEIATHEELTPAQQVALEPPYLYNRLGVENDGETVTIDSSNGPCSSSFSLSPSARSEMG